MAVDKQYVEEVTDANYEDILDEFGIEASYEQNDNGIDTEGYTVTTLRDMYDGDECEGRPVLSDIYTVEFKNKNTGEVRVNHKIDLVLFDDTYEDELEAYVFPINLNSDNIDFEKETVKDVSAASGLYALAMGLMELKAPGIHKAYNKLNIVNIQNLQNKVKAHKALTVRVVEKHFVDKTTKEETYYNSFRVLEGE